ncbi:hypothetical protein [Burkholderia ambifaria]
MTDIPPLPPKPPRPVVLLVMAAVVFVFDGIVIYHELRNAYGFAREGYDAMLWFECAGLAVMIICLIVVAWRGIHVEIMYRRVSHLHDLASALRDEIIRAIDRGKK